MRKSALVFLVVIFVASLMVLPVVLFAADGLNNPLDPSGGTGNADPRIIIGNLIRAVLGLVGSLGLAVFIYGGVTFITAAGNDEKVKKGKDMITWASLGLAVVFMSFVIVSFIISTFVNSGSGSGGSSGSGQPGSLPGQPGILP